MEEDRFEQFYIRWSRVDSIWIDAVVWRVAEWLPDGRPTFYNAGPSAPITDPSDVTPLFEMNAKWDGCCHVRFKNHFHFDDEAEVDALARLLKYIREPLCDKAGLPT